LLTLQFSMSVVMIMGAIAVYAQVTFMQQTDMGLQMDQVLIVHSDLDDNKNLKKQLQQFVTIKGVSLVGEAASPGSVVIEKSDVVVEREGAAADMDVFNTIGIDEHYFEVLSIKLLEGRNFNPDIPDDARHAFIVNEAFVRRMGWKTAIDKKLELHGSGKVIGVVKDFNYKSLHNVVEPLIMHYNLGGPNNEMLVKISAMSDVEVLKKVWRKVVGNEALDYSFLDSNFGKQYSQEQTVMAMFLVFSLLAIAQTCQGLFGLSSLITRQRLKEIGIRKVLGGTERNIIYHLLKDILVLLLVSLFLALPLAYYGIDQWIRDFAYRAVIGIWHYGAAWLLTVICTVLTAFYHTHKGVNVNPAVSLRYED
jgi:putative ABC transport system permease protein